MIIIIHDDDDDDDNNNLCYDYGFPPSFLQSIGVDHVFLHDPTTLVAVVRPDLFAYDKGPVVVELTGPLRGRTLQDPKTRPFWPRKNAWQGRPDVMVAVDVDAAAIEALLLKILQR